VDAGKKAKNQDFSPDPDFLEPTALQNTATRARFTASHATASG
jgi:hypothetical protein